MILISNTSGTLEAFTSFHHPVAEYFPLTAHPQAFYSSYITVTTCKYYRPVFAVIFPKNMNRSDSKQEIAQQRGTMRTDPDMCKETIKRVR